VRLDSEELKEFRVAHITGTGGFELSPPELRGLREFLTGGGTLLADAAGGSPEFVQALETEVRRAIRGQPRPVPRNWPLLTGEGIPGAVDLAEVSYRRAARRGAPAYPRLLAFQSGQRLSVIYSPLDLSASLLGTQIYDLRGYESDSALRIMRNLLLYADLPSARKVVRPSAEGD